MKDQNPKQKLIRSRDRIYHGVEFLFMTTVIVGLIILIGLQAHAISNSNARSAQNRKNNAALLKTIQDQNAEQIRADKCFATLFAQKDRQDVQLTDLNGCVLQKTSNTGDSSTSSGVSPPSATSSSQNPTQQPTTQSTPASPSMPKPQTPQNIIQRLFGNLGL